MATFPPRSPPGFATAEPSIGSDSDVGFRTSGEVLSGVEGFGVEWQIPARAGEQR